MSSTIWSMYAVACGILVGRRQPRVSMALPPLGLVPLGDLLRPAALLVRSSDDLVVDVGDVRDVVDLDPGVLEVAAQDVVDERETAVTDVRRPVDGRPADVQAEPAGLARLELGRCDPGPCHEGAAREYRTRPMQAPRVPDKPSLEGLEDRWSARWEKDGTYRFDVTKDRADVYSIDTPPPTVSGSLHVGHVFSYTQTDIVARYHRMTGKAVFYPIGWDDNGLPTERRVQEYFGVSCDPSLAYDPDFVLPPPPGERDKNARPVPISRPNFIELCLVLIAEDEQAFEQLFRKLGASVDWTQHYTTISEASRRASQRGFLRLLARDRGLPARGPDAVGRRLPDRRGPGRARRQGGAGLLPPASFREVIRRRSRRRDRDDPPRAGSGLRRARRPPDDDRYQTCSAAEVLTPAVRGRPSRSSPTSSPSRTRASGIAMICTFGDLTDVTWWRDLSLPTRSVVGAGRPARTGAVRRARLGVRRRLCGRTRHLRRDRRPADQPRPGADRGAPPGVRRPARRAATDHPCRQVLRDGASGLSRSSPPGSGTCARSTTARRSCARGRELQWHPEHMRARYEAWVEGLTGDWNISRQRFFGVPSRSGTGSTTSGEVLGDGLLLASEDRLPVDPSTDVPDGYTEDQRGKPGGFVGDPDVMDTWATSSLTPQIAGKWEEDPELFADRLPDGPSPASARDHPDMALLDDRALGARAREGAVASRRDLGMDPRSRTGRR